MMTALLTSIAHPAFALSSLFLFVFCFLGVLVWVFKIKTPQELATYAALPLHDVDAEEKSL